MHKVRLQGYDNNMNNTTVKTAKYKRGRMCSSLLGYLFFIHFKCCLNKSLLFSGHFTKDCFSAPGLQYALLPDEDDEEPRQQQTPSAAPQQDSDKKKKKKKVNMWRLMSQAVLTSFVCVCRSPASFLFLSLNCESFDATTHTYPNRMTIYVWLLYTERYKGTLWELSKEPLG